MLDREVEIAKICIKEGNKTKAMLALKKKKYQQSLLEKTDTQLLNLETLTSTIEYSLVEQQILNGLKSGNEILAQIQKEMSLEEVEKIMQDSADAVAYQNEISELLGTQMTEIDEQEIQNELELLQDSEQEVVIPELPNVPADIIHPAEEEESIDEKVLLEA